jgi:hypothetical protein
MLLTELSPKLSGTPRSIQKSKVQRTLNISSNMELHYPAVFLLPASSSELDFLSMKNNYISAMCGSF